MAYNRKQRLNDNIKAIETAFILDREQRTPTARERLLLERYCGFGGLKCILNPARELADAVHWAKSDLELFAPTVELHRLIRENSKNESEYKQLMDSLKQSVLTAFYTPSAITEALTDVLNEHQIIPEKVLEPSAGIGAFVESVLDNNPKADIMAFEKDLLTGKILRHLHRYIVFRSQFHSLHGTHAFIVRCHDNKWILIAVTTHPFQQVDTVIIPQAHIRNDNIPFRGFLHSFQTISVIVA